MKHVKALTGGQTRTNETLVVWECATRLGSTVTELRSRTWKSFTSKKESTTGGHGYGWKQTSSLELRVPRAFHALDSSLFQLKKKGQRLPSCCKGTTVICNVLQSVCLSASSR